jgi:hypothetical protein
VQKPQNVTVLLNNAQDFVGSINLEQVFAFPLIAVLLTHSLSDAEMGCN